MNNFIAQLQSRPGTYWVGAADLAALQQAISRFAQARALANGAARNKGIVASKNTEQAAARALCQQYARMIKHNAGISAQAKLDAGIKPPTTPTNRARECPLSPPILSVIAATNGAQTLTYSDNNDPHAKRKPLGADGLVLFVAISDEPVDDIEQAKFYRKFTTTPMPVLFNSTDRGKIATYFARWIGRRGDMSTPSAPVSMAIAA